MTKHFTTQTEFDNFLQRSGALSSQIGYQWTVARNEGAKNADELYKQYQYIRFALRALCPFEVGATDNLLTDEEVDTAYEQIILLGNLCDSNYLLNDTV